VGSSGSTGAPVVFDDFQNPLQVGSGGGTIVAAPRTNPTLGYQLAFSGPLTGSGTLTISNYGNPVVNFWNLNGFTGNILVTSDVAIEAYGSSNFGSGQISLGAGSILATTGGAKSVSNNILLNGNATLATDSAVYLMASGVVVTYSGNIFESGGSQSLTLRDDEPGLGNTIALSGTNTYTGNTTLLANTKVSVFTDSNLGTGALRLNGGSTFAISGSNTIDNAVNLLGNATVEAGTGVSAGLSGVISGVGLGLTKSGAGKLTLSGTNTYSGTTAVSSGTLDVTGSLAGATTVSNGAS
jgi:autotransporter-associated beta strand protein